MKKEVPAIVPETCLTCRACVGICPTGAISQLRREILVDYYACNGCGLCAKWCPAQAISLIKAQPNPKSEPKRTSTPQQLDAIYDLIIAGGGIAGLSTAIGTIRKNPNIRMLILEKKRKIGEDVNSSAGTWHFTLDMLPLTKKERESIVLQKFTKFGLAVEKESVVLDIGKAFLETIDLSQLQILLSEKLLKLGVQIETNSFVDSVERTRDGFITSVISKGTRYVVRSKRLVDATGIDSAISRKLGLHTGWNPNSIGIGAEYEMSWQGDPSTIWFVRMKHRNLSYAWSFPIGNNMARVGIAALIGAFKENNVTVQDELNLFLNSHFLIRENAGTKVSKTNFKCGAYPMMRMADKLVSDGTLRVGDAASQANPILGEGIYYAIKYGLKAGEALAEAGASSEEELQPYRDYVFKDSKKFEEDKIGYTADYDAMVKKLNELKDKLSKEEKWALLSFIMPLDSSWDAKLKIATKLLGYKETMRLAGTIARNKVGKLF